MYGQPFPTSALPPPPAHPPATLRSAVCLSAHGSLINALARFPRPLSFQLVKPRPHAPLFFSSSTTPGRIRRHGSLFLSKLGMLPRFSPFTRLLFFWGFFFFCFATSPLPFCAQETTQLASPFSRRVPSASTAKHHRLGQVYEVSFGRLWVVSLSHAPHATLFLVQYM